jgi:hypothetical protein
MKGLNIEPVLVEDLIQFGVKYWVKFYRGSIHGATRSNKSPYNNDYQRIHRSPNK